MSGERSVRMREAAIPRSNTGQGGRLGGRRREAGARRRRQPRHRAAGGDDAGIPEPASPEETLLDRRHRVSRAGCDDQNLVVIETLSARGEPGVMLKLLWADA